MKWVSANRSGLEANYVTQMAEGINFRVQEQRMHFRHGLFLHQDVCGSRHVGRVLKANTLKHIDNIS